ncbi:N-methyl-L-tryptophan oxidase [Paenibacillus sp. CECT 9249]|uniref:N-methyl-L-tryptophan oxidase n=1 Tax=unclassified Paenibacillus TaxID=185978 RepID=UPI001C10322E|nr:N-methyl-L-tryptophan oxidase [Paenibacillus sp. CECT 9249]MBU5440739.1 N-methyl-L-tryptophan oxidase [Paenibacillus sp. MSJ-34]CAH0120405.1 Monomeric sarcosine oxidase [Paenibacillus sp. CECT 9249]
MKTDYDVIIVGAGSFGMSAGYYLAKSGASVLLIDAHDPPHHNGSHHGETRIFRTAYTMGAPYVALALRSGRLWSELAEAVRESATLAEHSEIFRQTGVLSIGPAGSRFLRSKRESCEAFGIPYEYISARDLTARWPGFSVPERMEGLYEPNSGILFSERIIRAYRMLAQKYGAELLIHTRTLRIEQGKRGNEVYTENGAYCANNVLVAAGAWSAEVVPELLGRIQPVRKPIGWFKAPAHRYGDGTFPAFVVNKGGDEEYYGIPDLDGSGLKVGRHDGGDILAPGRPIPPFGAYRQDEEHLAAFVRDFLPEAGGLLQGSVCLYENAPGERFMLGPLPGRPGVWFAGGGSGHGFKFSSGIGQTIGEWLTTGQSLTDVSAFRI